MSLIAILDWPIASFRKLYKDFLLYLSENNNMQIQDLTILYWFLSEEDSFHVLYIHLLVFIYDSTTNKLFAVYV